MERCLALHSLSVQFLDFSFPEDESEHAQRRERARSGGREQYQCRLRKHDGAEIWLLVSATPLLDELTNLDQWARREVDRWIGSRRTTATSVS